jgi:hypothetical protein
LANPEELPNAGTVFNNVPPEGVVSGYGDLKENTLEFAIVNTVVTLAVVVEGLLVVQELLSVRVVPCVPV